MLKIKYRLPKRVCDTGLGNLILKNGGITAVITNALLYIIIFILGITFGSFYTLATYRIPLGQDITHKRSFCPNCNHKLGFLDLIPVFSYLFLRGKCRYCGKKISVRYILFEILSGLTFVLFFIPLKNGIINLNYSYIAYFIVGTVYISIIYILAGIDKEKGIIKNEVLLFGVIVEAIYIIYLYTFEKANIYRYVMYLFVVMVLFICNNIYFSKKANNNYRIQSIICIIIMAIFSGEIYTILSIILMLLSISIYEIIKNARKKKYVKSKKKKEVLPICFYLCSCNLIIMIITNLFIL